MAVAAAALSRSRYDRYCLPLLGHCASNAGPIVYLLFRPAESLDDVRSRRVELRAPTCTAARDPRPRTP